jgi:hypothetical protein
MQKIIPICFPLNVTMLLLVRINLAEVRAIHVGSV